jgi:hypothetical protein
MNNSVITAVGAGGYAIVGSQVFGHKGRLAGPTVPEVNFDAVH